MKLFDFQLRLLLPFRLLYDVFGAIFEILPLESPVKKKASTCTKLKMRSIDSVIEDTRRLFEMKTIN